MYDRNSEEIYVHIEKYVKETNTVLFDFVDSNEFIFFQQLYNIPYDYGSRPTMVLITNYKLRPLREGTTYRISRTTIEKLQEGQRLQIYDNSLLIGFRIELTDSTEIFFGQSKAFSETEKFFKRIENYTHLKPPTIELSLKGNVEVIVRNIGQGSWNEICINSRKKLVFDIGTIWTTSRTDLIAMLSTRNEEYENDRPVLILSHWDVDHYHFLLTLSDAGIQAFTHFICRGYLPTLTARKVFSRFKMINPNAVISFPCEIPAIGKYSKKLVRRNLNTSHNICLFNGSNHPDINKSGIGLIIQTKNTSVIFSADFDYRQISNYMLPHLNYKHKHHLVVPHHGGKAGPFTYAYPTSIQLADAIVSVGTNPYRPAHPWAKYITSLNTTGFRVLRTDTLGRDHLITM
jgi:beta-lactamase superfamily II metal-dependent hydrolase